ncbi:flavin reductase family protein [Nocardiopsis suaedae]|uniref:Flavin reductase family protein n=1 Tax=Nocardiopsis suaedae TaxID=3018444 RepID=A0ABT4TSJ6_9ACTN|nr:flavin reductase family protein [Nocardiopsis suaedae]MDA2807637.1 flavin reductase family protein [Nocardiopsis suaedae]
MAISGTDYTDAMARVPSPVSVVTTRDASGRRWGFTSSSFCSLSKSPPLVLVCLDRSASTHEAFVSASHFMVNLLAHDQADVARTFATSGVDRFAAGDMVACELGLPGLSDAAVRLACSMRQVLGGGDHSILVGHVEEAHLDDARPLTYWNRNFTHVAAPRSAVGSG